MHLSSDDVILWQHGFFKLNLTILTTWGLMLVMVVISRVVTKRLSDGMRIPRLQGMLEVIVSTTSKQVEEVGLAHPEKYLGFLGTLFLFVALSNLCEIIPGYEPPTG